MDPKNKKSDWIDFDPKKLFQVVSKLYVKDLDNYDILKATCIDASSLSIFKYYSCYDIFYTGDACILSITWEEEIYQALLRGKYEITRIDTKAGVSLFDDDIAEFFFPDQFETSEMVLSDYRKLHRKMRRIDPQYGLKAGR